MTLECMSCLGSFVVSASFPPAKCILCGHVYCPTCADNLMKLANEEEMDTRNQPDPEIYQRYARYSGYRMKTSKTEPLMPAEQGTIPIDKARLSMMVDSIFLQEHLVCENCHTVPIITPIQQEIDESIRYRTGSPMDWMYMVVTRHARILLEARGRQSPVLLSELRPFYPRITFNVLGMDRAEWMLARRELTEEYGQQTRMTQAEIESIQAEMTELEMPQSLIDIIIKRRKAAKVANKRLLSPAEQTYFDNRMQLLRTPETMTPPMQEVVDFLTRGDEVMDLTHEAFMVWLYRWCWDGGKEVLNLSLLGKARTTDWEAITCLNVAFSQLYIQHPKPGAVEDESFILTDDGPVRGSWVNRSRIPGPDEYCEQTETMREWLSEHRHWGEAEPCECGNFHDPILYGEMQDILKEMEGDMQR